MDVEKNKKGIDMAVGLPFVSESVDWSFFVVVSSWICVGAIWLFFAIWLWRRIKCQNGMI